MGDKATQLSPFGHAFVGALGAVFANSAIYPLDTVKTVIQATKMDKKKAKDDPARLGIIYQLSKIFKEEGAGGFYKGFWATMLNTFSTQYAYFFFYSGVRFSYLKRISKRLPPGSPLPILSTATELILGAVAGALAQVFTIPVSVIAVRQQLGKTRHGFAPNDEEKNAPLEDDNDNSFLAVGKKIVREDGITGLWLGLKPSLVLTINPAITYGVFERLKSLLLLAKGLKTMSPWIAFLVGATSKTLATVVTYPYIMAKVRIQAGDVEEKEIIPAIEYKKNSTKGGAAELLKRVYKEQGLLGWYQGMRAQIIKAVISQALLFVCKDLFEIYALRILSIYAAFKGR